MHKIVNDILVKGGWFEGRKVPIDDVINYWKKEKYPLYPDQINFIQEFHNLGLRFHNINGHQYHIEIDPLSNGVPSWALKKYIKYANANLVYFGEVVCQDTFLFITQDSKIYGAYEDEIVFWGNNFYESLENVYFDNISWEIMKDFFVDIDDDENIFLEDLLGDSIKNLSDDNKIEK
ncbi:MAG: hypothetical protein HDT22_02600 [Ruminococcus sp.]|nr:hypothetical protein [Ruminococcus sp.]